MGIAVPGTFPGELAATRSDYARWFRQIKDAGFNAIRLYTLHFPRFYEVLDSFNRANPQNPLLFIQGVWLEEEIYGYKYDLNWLTPSFRNEIKENIDAVHGNLTIAPRRAKAYGNFRTDVSQWCLAFILGREIHGIEVATTDANNVGVNRFIGNHFGIENASPSEIWATRMLDYAVSYQQQNYNTQRPISKSSWPTLDPLPHPEEVNREEDMAHIDLSKLQLLNAPAGFFLSYHAYPYFPDFISWQSSYQGYFDEFGPNSYLGYLTELRNHYRQFPLIIAEFGLPSSWLNAHYSTSGMNHGGMDEKQQGIGNLRILNTIRRAGAGGGLQFSWLDEWFKRTWVADPLDAKGEDRVLWGNKASPEQNFGLVSFSRPQKRDTIARFASNQPVSYLIAGMDYSFLNLEIGLNQRFGLHDEMWVALDTYAATLGESVLPNGAILPSGTRAEFALLVTQYSARLYVTLSYDAFNMWHRLQGPGQLYRSTPSNGAPWNIVRTRNNHPYREVHFIGNLQVSLDFEAPSTLDAVVIYDRKLSIRLPWNFINFTAPNRMGVLHDVPNTSAREDTVSDGVIFSVRYGDAWFSNPVRFTWPSWHYVKNTAEMEQLKKSYFVFKDNQSKFNTRAVAFRDNYRFTLPRPAFFVSAAEGLLQNDFDLDGNNFTALISENPANGRISLRTDGSFTYIPNPGFLGYDSLRYVIFDGHSLSIPGTAIFQVLGSATLQINDQDSKIQFDIFPNPVTNFFTVRSNQLLENIQIYDIGGQLIKTLMVNDTQIQVNASSLKQGIYIIVGNTRETRLTGKFVKQ